MTRIINTRGTGKTLQLFLLAKESDGIVVCANPYAFESKALRYGMTGITFISYFDYQTRSYDTGKKVFIDDLEGFVKSTSGRDDLAGYTLSID